MIVEQADLARREFSSEELAELWASLTPEEREWATLIRERQSQLRELEYYKVKGTTPRGWVRAKLEAWEKQEWPKDEK